MIARLGFLCAWCPKNILKNNGHQLSAGALSVVNEAQVAHVMRAHETEAQKMIIPEAIRPVHHNTRQSMLKKTRAVQPATPPTPTVIDQIMNVDLASAEGAARAHARSGGDASTLMGRIIDHGSTVRSTASNILKKGVKKAFMASASAAVTALRASTTKGIDVAAPKPPIVTAKAASAQPRATPAPPSEQPATATRTRARAIANAVVPPPPSSFQNRKRPPSR